MKRRIRKFILISGTSLCLLIATAFVASAFWQAVIQVGGEASVYVIGGSVTLIFGGPLDEPFVIEPHGGGLFRWDEMTFDWNSSVELPLFTLLSIFAVPTLLVWRFVSKFPRGHCRRCGCNLTGLTETRCPECGTAFDAKSES